MTNMDVANSEVTILLIPRRVATVSTPKNHKEGAPGPSLLGTGETPDLN